MKTQQTADTIKQFIKTDEEGFSFSIDVNKTFKTGGDGLWSTAVKDVFVRSINIYIETADEGYFGDLAINYDNATWNDEVDGLIYTDDNFLEEAKEFLIDNGFDAEAVNSIDYSEQGMQDDERVSCDANLFATYVLNLVQVQQTA